MSESKPIAIPFAPPNVQAEELAETQPQKSDTIIEGRHVGDEYRAASVPAGRFWFLCIGVSLSLFLALLDTSIVATAVYTIGVEFQASETINWVALAYTLAYLSCAVTLTRISDIIGRRITYLACQVAFVAFSIACGFSQNLPQLVAFRVVQGIGASGLYSLALIILTELCPENIEHHMSSIIGVVLAGAGVLGPVIGGLLTHNTDWRWIFWINGPIGAVSIAVFWFAWPRPEHLPTLQLCRWREFDIMGSIFLIAAATLVVFAFQNAGDASGKVWDQAIFIAPLLLGLAFSGALLLWEIFIVSWSRARIVPVFPVSLFRNRFYAVGSLVTILLGFVFLLLVFSVPLRAQVVGGKNSMIAGLILLPMLVSTALGSGIAGRVSKVKDRSFETMLAGSALMALACGLLTSLERTSGVGKTLGFLVFAGLGFGLSTAAITMIALFEAPIKDRAPAQGIIAQLRILGGSLGISASTVFVHNEVSNIQITGTQGQSRFHNLEGSADHLTKQDLLNLQSAYASAFRQGMITAAAISGLATLAACLAFKRHRITTQEKRVTLQKEENDRRATQASPMQGEQ